MSQITGPGEVSCSVTAATPQQALSANGDRVSLSITAARDCLWSANANASWLQVTPAEGQGAGAVVATAASNPGSDPRIATVSINGTSVTIVQTGTTTSVPSTSPAPVDTAPGPTAPPDQTPASPPSPPPSTPTCTAVVSPTTVAVDSNGGAGRIVVTVSSGCAWAAVSNAGWLTITSGRNGTGNGEVNYSVQEQKGKGSRSTTLSVAGVTVTVTQSGRTN